MTLFEIIYNFFRPLFDYYEGSRGLDIILDDTVIIFNEPVSVSVYLSFVATLILFCFIIVLCCLFVYKIIKIVGNLIR